jgi:hypothetical protein
MMYKMHTDNLITKIGIDRKEVNVISRGFQVCMNIEYRQQRATVSFL